jgi:hypothetical protein
MNLNNYTFDVELHFRVLQQTLKYAIFVASRKKTGKLRQKYF